MLFFSFPYDVSANELPRVSALPSLTATPSLPSIQETFGASELPSLLGSTGTSMPSIDFWDEDINEYGNIPFRRPSYMTPVDPSFAATLIWPVFGNVSSGFGPRFDRQLNRMRMHEGIDIPAVQGTPIRAAAGGIVTEARSFRGYGLTVVIDHGNGMQTLYAHCSKLAVTQGELVERGQVIAYVGSTGRSSGAHLHFAVIFQGAYRDPKAFLPDTSQQLAYRPGRQHLFFPIGQR